MILEIIILIILVVLFINVPSDEDTWKMARMSCKLLVMEGEKTTCFFDSKIAKCSYKNCPMMKID